jgi:hypothetical protein
MRLDAVLTSPHLEWLTTPSEKVAYLHARTAHESPEAPDNATTQGAADLANPFPGTVPVGIDSGGHMVLLYLVTVPWTDDFRAFLVGHTALLRVAAEWTLRLVFPQPLRRALTTYQTVVHEELESPLQPDVIYDVRRYFFHRRRDTDLNAIPEGLRAFLNRCASRFSGPRFTHLYRRWLTAEDAAFTPVSPVIQEALASGCAHVECVVLPHRYEHLSSLASHRRRRRRRPEERDGRGAATPHALNSFVNPVP